MKPAAKYRIHRTLGIIVVPFLIISTATGFFKTNQKWYWEDGYKRKKQPSGISVETPLVEVNRLLQKIDSLSQKKNAYQEISLQSEQGHLYYRLLTTSKEKYLIDACTGKISSPLTGELASSFAAQYVKEKPAVKSCELVKNYISRRGKEKRPAYNVVFDNAVHSQVVLDYYTGEIIEDIDDNRKFGIWVMRLHEFDFFDAKRGITSAVGISIFLLSFSGLWIYKMRRKNKNIPSR